MTFLAGGVNGGIGTRELRLALDQVPVEVGVDVDNKESAERERVKAED
jgi:hypothetical protein